MRLLADELSIYGKASFGQVWYGAAGFGVACFGEKRSGINALLFSGNSALIGLVRQ